VLSAINEFNQVGRDIFLKRYGFGRSREYFLIHDGHYYDSKAIAGASLGYGKSLAEVIMILKGPQDKIHLLRCSFSS